MIEMAWELDLPLPAWKLVLMAILHESADGDFWDEDVMQIARMTSLSAMAVENAIVGFEARGILERCQEPCPEVFHIFLAPKSRIGLKTPQIVS